MYVSNQLYSTAQIRSSSRAHAQLGTRLPLTANMPKMLCTSRCSQSPKWLASLCMVISGPLKTEGYTREVRERVKMVGGCRHTQESQEKNHTTQLSATIRQPPPHTAAARPLNHSYAPTQLTPHSCRSKYKGPVWIHRTCPGGRAMPTSCGPLGS